MWKATHSATVNAPSTAVWARWRDVEKWPDQDISLKSAKISGAFELGSTITLRPNGLPKIKARLAIVTPEVGFAYVGKLPLATIQFTHDLEPLDTGTTFTHSVSINGPLWWFYAELFGRTLERNLKARVNKIASLIEYEYKPSSDDVN